jgi:hypothetical protein
MRTEEKILKEFWRLLEERPRRGEAPADFPAYCRRLHVVPGVLDEILIRETGLCGEEIILIW